MSTVDKRAHFDDVLNRFEARLKTLALERTATRAANAYDEPAPPPPRGPWTTTFAPDDGRAPLDQRRGRAPEFPGKGAKSTASGTKGAREYDRPYLYPKQVVLRLTE